MREQRKLQRLIIVIPVLYKRQLLAGTHKLEVWGAQGGGSSSHPGGMGGYSYGTLTLTKDTTAYIYVGGQGTNDDGSFSSKATLAGGFNGGGSGVAWTGTSNNGGGGGGASDIRLTEDSLYSRVIVAGGGGGGSDNANGGYGGGTSGGNGSMSGGSSSSGYSFGSGGNATYTSGECGGGGSGWYGGTGGSSEDYAGGGGSGYVYTSSTASSYPSGVKLNSNYYLTNAATIAGNTSFTDNSGSTVTGHSGNGYARITSTVKASTEPSIDTSEMILKPNATTNLKDTVTCNDNGNGCKIVLVNPSSSEKLTIGSNSVMYVLEDNSGNRYKYTKSILYGYYLRGYAASAVKDADDGSTGDDGSGVYKISHEAIASGSSATGSDIKANDDYRYYGASPNNYICLDKEGQSICPDRGLYRIIGSIYEENAGKNLIKVIKATPLKSGISTTYNWDSSTNKWATVTSGNYSNSLTSGASLMILLNSGDWWSGTTTYAGYDLTETAKSMVNTSRYYLGGYSSSGVETTAMYGYERGIYRVDATRPLYWDGYVGLMYPSDYGYAAGNSCASGTSLGSYYSSCKSKDWLFYNSSKFQWLMTPSRTSANTAWNVTSSGYANITSSLNYVSSTGLVFPVFYLISDVNITDGEGTKSNPYLLS